MSLNVENKYQNLEDLINVSSYFYRNNIMNSINEDIIDNRKKISFSIEKFHKEFGTLTGKVKEKIFSLRKEDPILLLMTAHQPNLFPYSGVIRKATLNFVLGKELERKLGVQVVNFFGIADQDFTDDRWVKNTIIPAMDRRDGILTLNIDLPQMKMLKDVSKPSKKVLDNWKDMIEKWLHNTTRSINAFYKKQSFSNWDLIESTLHENFEKFWNMVEESSENVTTYSDFNTFIITKIVNEIWGYDTLFARFSECQKIFTKEFNYLIHRFNDYSNSLKNVIEILTENKVRSGVSKNEPDYLPFWYHCDCGGKARLKAEQS